MSWDKTVPADGSLGLASEIRNNFVEIDRLMRSGSSTTAGESGVSIIISPALADTNYTVDIELTDAQFAFAGEIRITDKATNGFIVRNTGDSGIAFNWATRPKI